MVPVPESPVKFKRWVVAPIHFEMDGVHPHLVGSFFGKSESLAAKAAAAILRSNVQLIDERIVAVELEAKANGQNDIADERRACVEQPGATKRRKRQELTKGPANSGFVKLDGLGLMFVESAHHWHKSGFVLQRRFTKLQRKHVTHRFVR